MRTATVTMHDGTKVVVPDSLESITSYVLIEQQDWFEDEIKFLRKILHSGECFIDIGANHGVYSLSLAQRIKPNGESWAFEPEASTARLLEESIAANGLASVIHIETCAISDRTGTATLTRGDNSEKNASIKDEDSKDGNDQIAQDSLDAYMDRYQWKDVAFVRINAEGCGTDVLRGGARFFDMQSPLVMFAARTGVDNHLELIDSFASLGYALHRLVPGLGALLPFNPRQGTPDGFLLNLFFCKSDRVERLIGQGMLAPWPATTFDTHESSSHSPNPDGSFIRFAEQKGICAQFIPLWKKEPQSAEAAASKTTLDHYAISQSKELSLTKRYLALKAAYDELCCLCQKNPTHGRLASLGRIARDIGARDVAIEALSALVKYLGTNSSPDFAEPFLPADPRFDDLPPGNSAEKWFAAGALEALERTEDFSSFYSGSSHRQRLRVIAEFGFSSPEMQRRLQLIEARFPDSTTASGTAPLLPRAQPGINSQQKSPLSEHTELMNLHIGGKEPKPGWKILNIQEGDGVDYVGDIRDLSQFPDQTFDTVYASHVFEHIQQTAALPTLQGIHRILKRGGCFYISVPDLGTLARLITAPNISIEDEWHIMRMIFGGQTDPFDFHYCGWTFTSLSHFLKLAGFDDIHRVTFFNLFNDASCGVKNGTPISLNLIAKKT